MAHFEHSIGEVSTNRAILIRVKNADALARSQGSVAAFAQGIAPATIEAKVYAEIQKKLSDSLRAQNVDAEVSVVEPNAFRLADGSSHIATDIGFAIGGAGVLAILWYVFSGRRK